MADHEIREYDELDKALAAQPLRKAPRNLRSNVMARIATAPQTAPVALSETARYSVPVITYAPPAITVDTAALELAEAVEQVSERVERRFWLGFMISGAWVGGCLLILWLLWPAISNLIFGPSNDPEMQARLVTLQNFWGDLTGYLRQTLTDNGTFVLTLLSFALGLALMLAMMVGPFASRNQNNRLFPQ